MKEKLTIEQKGQIARISGDLVCAAMQSNIPPYQLLKEKQQADDYGSLSLAYYQLVENSIIAPENG